MNFCIYSVYLAECVGLSVSLTKKVFTTAEMRNNYISNKLSHVPYASAVLNAIHEPQHLIALRYPHPVIKSDHYVYSEVEAVEKLIHRKF